MLSISAQSTEYIRCQIQATNAGVAVDPTSDTVQMAFVAEGTTPLSGDWKTASWEIDTTQSPTADFARALVGSGGVITLVAGTTYDCWIKVSDNPEVPVKKAGSLRAY